MLKCFLAQSDQRRLLTFFECTFANTVRKLKYFFNSDYLLIVAHLCCQSVTFTASQADIFFDYVIWLITVQPEQCILYGLCFLSTFTILMVHLIH